MQIFCNSLEAKADLNRCEAIYSVAVNIHILLQNDACVCGVLTQIQLACPAMLGMSCGPYFFSKIRNVLNSQTFLTQMVSDPRAGAFASRQFQRYRCRIYTEQSCHLPAPTERSWRRSR